MKHFSIWTEKHVWFLTHFISYLDNSFHSPVVPTKQNRPRLLYPAGSMVAPLTFHYNSSSLAGGDCVYTARIFVALSQSVSWRGLLVAKDVCSETISPLINFSQLPKKHQMGTFFFFFFLWHFVFSISSTHHIAKSFKIYIYIYNIIYNTIYIFPLSPSTNSWFLY